MMIKCLLYLFCKGVEERGNCTFCFEKLYVSFLRLYKDEWDSLTNENRGKFI